MEQNNTENEAVTLPASVQKLRHDRKQDELSKDLPGYVKKPFPDFTPPPLVMPKDLGGPDM